jgi:FtsH-binding integral membrane protein
MAGGSVLAAAVLNIIAVTSGFRVEREIWLGMLCPALASIVSWWLMARQTGGNPQGMTRFMIQAFVAKILFFAACIVVLLQSGLVRPKLFAACFAGFYIALHLVEAVGLQRWQRTRK